MLLDTQTAPVQHASRVHTSTSRNLLAIVELYQRAKKLHEQDAGRLICRSVLRDLLSALHYRDENTFLHSQRVGQLVVGLSRQLYWNEETQNLLEIAALLHDIGKIGIPDHILYKPGEFSGDESSLMAIGTELTYNILQICHAQPVLRQTVLESRMSYSFLEDQSRALGTEISLAGRLLAVADVYDSLSRNQVYRDAFSHKEIISYLQEHAGTHFDPNMVTALDRWLKPKVLDQLQISDDAPQAQLEGSLATTSLCNIFTTLYSLESSFDGVMIADVNRKIIFQNRGIQSLFGQDEQAPVVENWNPQSFPIADPYQELFEPGSYPIEKSLETKRATTFDVKLPGKTGKWVDVEMQSLPFVDFNDQLQGVAEFYKYKDRTHQQSTQYRELALQASRDALTGVANRGELENQLSILMDKFQADSHENFFSVIYLDIDHFKQINDTYGHAVGDEVLVNLAAMLQSEAYSSEFVARYGGEEFVIICPDLHLTQAVGRAERFRLAISKLKFTSEPGLTIASSFGVSESEINDCLESILKRSDQALYQSKREGRNRTSFLKRADMIHTDSEAEINQDTENDLSYSSELRCMLHEDILVMKLKGFVQEQKARLVSIDEGKAVIQIGNQGFFTRWGKKAKRQPVRIAIDATDALRPSTGRSPKRRLEIKIEPIGEPQNKDIFLDRAMRVFRDMKSHFLSE